jgi:hypothetical protein
MNSGLLIYRLHIALAFFVCNQISQIFHHQCFIPLVSTPYASWKKPLKVAHKITIMANVKLHAA